MPYPPEALREVLANAVAHALYQRNQGEIIVDLFPDRFSVKNNALIEAKAFSKQWFARQTHVKNKLLMSTLRVAKISDELGSGNTWSDIQEKLDEHYKKIAIEVVKSDSSPVLVIDNRFLLKRWANIALTGQQTKSFSLAEEENIFSVLQAYSFQNGRDGLVTTQEARS